MTRPAAAAHLRLSAVAHSTKGVDLHESPEAFTPPEIIMLCGRLHALSDFDTVLLLLCTLQVVHCDLKAKNILLNQDRSRAKIGDVGLARTMFETHLSTASGFFGTFSYAAPEVLLRRRCNEKVCKIAFLWALCEE